MVFGSTNHQKTILFLFSFLLNKRIQSAGTIPSSITGCGNAGATDVNTTEFTAMGYISTSGCSDTAVACPGGADHDRSLGALSVLSEFG